MCTVERSEAAYNKLKQRKASNFIFKIAHTGSIFCNVAFWLSWGWPCIAGRARLHSSQGRQNVFGKIRNSLLFKTVEWFLIEFEEKYIRNEQSTSTFGRFKLIYSKTLVSMERRCFSLFPSILIENIVQLFSIFFLGLTRKEIFPGWGTDSENFWTIQIAPVPDKAD